MTKTALAFTLALFASQTLTSFAASEFRYKFSCIRSEGSGSNLPSRLTVLVGKKKKPELLGLNYVNSKKQQIEIMGGQAASDDASAYKDLVPENFLAGTADIYDNFKYSDGRDYLPLVGQTNEETFFVAIDSNVKSGKAGRIKIHYDNGLDSGENYKFSCNGSTP